MFDNSNKIVSISDDKTLRVWDSNNKTEILNLKFDNIPSNMEISKDGKILILAHGNKVELYNTDNLTQIKSFNIPRPITAVTIHPNKEVFVCSGDDFTLSKYSIENGAELESFKGHFGPVHCIQYSPDGEIYASGSEDGTLRLWQNTIGKTYGLWKCVNSNLNESNLTNPNGFTTVMG